MARPRKAEADKRDRKIVVWVTATELAGFMLNATRAGLTGPDYIRAVACAGGRARSEGAIGDDMVVSLSPAERRALLAKAGRAGLPVEHYVIEAALGEAGGSDAPTSGFELIDALVRNGTNLQRLVAIGEATGHVPDEINTAIDRIERVLDRLLPS